MSPSHSPSPNLGSQGTLLAVHLLGYRRSQRECVLFLPRKTQPTLQSPAEAARHFHVRGGRGGLGDFINLGIHQTLLEHLAASRCGSEASSPENANNPLKIGGKSARDITSLHSLPTLRNNPQTTKPFQTLPRRTSGDQGCAGLGPSPFKG